MFKRRENMLGNIFKEGKKTTKKSKLSKRP